MKNSSNKSRVCLTKSQETESVVSRRDLIWDSSDADGGQKSEVAAMDGFRGSCEDLVPLEG